MPGNVDRRPWLILSAAEGQALLEAALAQAQPSEDLCRAMRVLRNQLQWLRDGRGEQPSPKTAAQRDERPGVLERFQG
jgi:hypothetical protein